MSEFGTASYDHVQFYVKSLKTLDQYKSWESQSNQFFSGFHSKSAAMTVEEGRALYKEIMGSEPVAYSSLNQDLIEQLIWGVGWRITQYYSGPETTSVVICSNDPSGTKFIATAPSTHTVATASPSKKPKTEEKFEHFKQSNLDRFFGAHGGRPGFAVLGFRAAKGSLDLIINKYRAKHPKLLVHQDKFSYEADDKTFYVVEVYAYYSNKCPEEADLGTVLRFVESEGTGVLLPGLVAQAVEYSLGAKSAAYFDHWVSNVVDRSRFLATLEDCLGFTPKVDFNAGVVAAGEVVTY